MIELEWDEETDKLLDKIEPQGIALPPGYRLAAVARFILTPRSYKRYVEPVIADMQYEYIEAIAKGHDWHARWITVRGHVLIIPGSMEALLVGAVKRWLSPK